MSLTTEGRLTVAEAATTADDELTPDNAPLFRTTVTITQPAQDAEHAATLMEMALSSEYIAVGQIFGYVEVEVGEPEALEA